MKSWPVKISLWNFAHVIIKVSYVNPHANLIQIGSAGASA